MQLGVIRFYSMVTFVVGVLAVAVLAAHVTSYFIPENHHVNIKEAHVANLGDMWRKYDQAELLTDLDASLGEVWNWATRMLFVYVKGSYIDTHGQSHEVVIWDQRVSSREEAEAIVLTSAAKYPMRSLNLGELEGKEVTITLGYNILPIGGLLKWRTAVEAVKTIMPQKYST